MSPSGLLSPEGVSRRCRTASLARRSLGSTMTPSAEELLRAPEEDDVLLEYRLPYFLATAAGIGLALLLFHLHRRPASDAPGSQEGSDWRSRLSFLPEELGGFSYRRLVLVSALGLFLELLLIRWISSEIRIFAYFKNFVLIACFLGFGLGAHLCKRRIHLLASFAPLLYLSLLVKLPWPPLRSMVADLPLYLGSFSEVHIWGIPSMDPTGSRLLPFLAAMLLSVAIFGLIALTFIPVGQLIGWNIENAANGISAYSANVLASLGGILLFVFLCFLYQPPLVWLSLAAVMFLALFWKIKPLRWISLVSLLLCLGLLSLRDDPEATDYWSPYQKLSLSPTIEDGEIMSYSIETNNSWYQHVVDLSPAFVNRHPGRMKGIPLEFEPYNLPYRFFPAPPSVLVLGAGMGNDVAAALRNGAQRVVAVEIDPLIQRLGAQFHFEKPYDSPRVEVVIDDARSYIQGSDEKFDMVVFSLLDSHTTSSHFSNIRIDNYVYTVEALQRARQLLKPDGLFIVKFQVSVAWIAARLEGLMEEVFGWRAFEVQAPTSFTAPGRFFFTGSKARLENILQGDDELRSFVERHARATDVTATLTTDDWPYFYQHEPGLPGSVIVMSLMLVVLCWLAIPGIGLRRKSIHWHFFFLGAAFLLLEAQLVSKMALLFGTTWLVNSVVISGVLLLIFAANVFAEKVPRLSIRFAYSGLFTTLIVSWALPMPWLFLDSVVLRALVAGLLLCSPVFFAGIVFIKSFAAVRFSGDALGSNLIGALIGGTLESLSLWTGISSLLILAALLYLASCLFLVRRAAS